MEKLCLVLSGVRGTDVNQLLGEPGIQRDSALRVDTGLAIANLRRWTTAAKSTNSTIFP